MTAPTASSQEEMRRNNLATLLRLLHIHGQTSRAALTALTGLNRSTVKALVAQLADLGLVRESMPGAGTGAAGRPSITVEPASDQIFVIAVEIGVEHLSAARVGLGGVVLDRRSGSHSRGGQSVSTIVRRAGRMVTALLDAAGAGTSCVGVGVSVPGLVAVDDGLVRLAPNLGWRDVALGTELSKRIDASLPITIGNDADLGALAEYTRGASAGVPDLVYLSGAVGVGGGIIVGGKPLAGAGGYAGEIGHMVVHPRGRECRCGARGCWETEVGEEAILRATKSPPGTTLTEVRRAFNNGDRAAKAGVREVAHWLGIGIANIVNLVNPQVVIFGGSTQDVYDVAQPFVLETLLAGLTPPLENFRLMVSSLDGNSPLLGAAEAAFARLLANPAEVACDLPEVSTASARSDALAVAGSG